MGITQIVRAKSRRVLLFIKSLFQHLSFLEKLIVIILILVIIFSAAALIKQKIGPGSNAPAFGGIYAEGEVGQPGPLNPLFADSDAERDIASLLYAGLLKYNDKHELVGDLIDKWEVAEDGKDYKFTLKNNIFWSDGQPITVEDIFYTITLTKSPDYTGPMKSLFTDVAGSKTNDREFELRLNKPYAPFINSLTLKILPSHVWKDVPIKNIALADLNQKPISSGPFVMNQAVRSSGKISEIVFQPNEKYFDAKPFIESLSLKFFEKEEDLVNKIRSQEIMGGVVYDPSQSVSRFSRVAINKIKLPQYVALFFNQKNSPILAEKAVRDAIGKTINKDAIIKDVYSGNAEEIGGPILPGYLGYEKQDVAYSPNDARTELGQAGWVMNDKTQEKQGKKLQFSITTVDDSQYVKTAQEIAKQLADIGMTVDVKKISSASIPQEIIKQKNYEALLFGENIGADPDVFNFWHSSQIASGYNLALFENAEADKLLEEARQTIDTNLRGNDYKRFQEILASKVPAVFLYRPYASYLISKKIQGVVIPEQLNNASERFDNINQWYIKTR